MLRNSSLTAEALLHRLLDRFEAPNLRTRDITQPIDYTAVGGPAAQDEFHRVLKEAARAGGVALEKGRMGRFTGEFARVRLTDAGRLYTFLSRAPAAAIAVAAETRLKEAIHDILEEPLFKALAKDAVAAWRVNKSSLGQTAMQVETFILILRLAHGILHLSGRDIDHRTFSRRIVKDSKVLERLEGRVAQVLKRHNPQLIGEDPRDVLEANGIVRRAHLLQVKGPLQVSDDDILLKGTGAEFVGLTWRATQSAELNQPIDYIITIENPTSFWRYCTEIRGSYLALLSDGFPARDVLSGMVHLVRAAQMLHPCPVYHWGDIDAGGVRIAAHLEDAFGVPLQLHEMVPAIAERLGTPLRSRSGLTRLSARTGTIGALARWLDSPEAMSLEQEELDPVAPVISAASSMSHTPDS